ncbi:MAG: permease prefix domain 1-containing protein [Bifidobacterium tibiigranuli]|jgi:hypothetical protein|uniref:permease prefix domain 1-containing protein n=1 Tax=Bifidobacterium tibiigranuli TaxID=2172043 RepID=UPI0023557DE4|nr:permease prefix domain 1-containing protein [Bifidobacterium tibiigranuli]MCH3974493.1 permease prefix domain 1-containing protein [Bifidobacterium tibiigranuli]MCH4190531.1 permease prefix domain 1-containing protein [Bifidobacterium tibiigranuli]MCH4204608.1 permease prefix domain 1-containing protein [Bifidobacterium tibiigranuli]MCH4275309.1 permease prefix domain 1-containing protein [Bifidobacterium tibiigranuli]MCI1792198.1 permease prefix domain 1-containing protein [Bifidobacterium
MNILDNYLDTMFSRYPLTPETQEAKRELRAMMEDSYNGAIAAGRSQNEAIGQAIAEFGNIEEVAPTLGLAKTEPVFGGSTFGASAFGGPAPAEHAIPQSRGVNGGEGANAGTGRSETGATTAATSGGVPAFSQPMPEKRAFTMAQAQNYMDTMRQTRWLLGIGVALIVFAAAPFVGLAVAHGSVGGMRENFSLLLGFALLLPLVGVGVGLLVYRNQRLSPFRRITSGMDRCTPEIEAYANAAQQQESSKRTIALVIAVILWILSALPILSAGIFTQDWPQDQADPLLGLGTAATLVLVSLGLLIFLPANWVNFAQTHLVQTSPDAIAMNDSEQDATRYPVWVRAIFSGFWLVITAVYLVWSFITGNWGITWIVWPIAAIAFSAFAAIVGTIYPSHRP